MNRFLLLVTIGASLAAAAGCGASAARHSAVPAATAVAEVSTSDPSWTPPGEMEVSYGEDAREASEPRALRPSTEIKPNAADKPVRGAVHAAVY